MAEVGLWCGSISIGRDARGRQRRRSVYARTKADAQAKLHRLQTAMFNGSLSDETRVTVQAFLTRWLEDAARPSIRVSTYDSYRRLIGRHVLPQLGHLKLRALNPPLLQALYAKLEQNGASARLRQLVHAVLHRAFGQAVRWGMMTRNVCEAVDRPRVPARTMRVLDLGQTRALLAAAVGDRLEALYVLAVASGMRQGELLGLRWTDVDGRGRVSVQRSLADLNGHLYFEAPKSRAGQRVIDLPAFAVDALKRHRERMLAEGHRATELVFCDSTGQPLRRSNLVRRSFEPLLRRAGLPRLRFHDLRHTAATLLLADGVHPKIVQERLGHAQITMTLGTYSHVLPSMQQATAQKLDRLLA